MKNLLQNRGTCCRVLATSIASVLLSALLSRAANIRWDVSPGTAGAGDGTVTGGAGQWDTISAFWTADGGQTNLTWNNANNDTAVFGAGSGTVSVVEPITVGGLTFESSDYFIAGSPITLGSATPTVTVNPGFNATISSVLNGSAGLTITGG